MQKLIIIFMVVCFLFSGFCPAAQRLKEAPYIEIEVKEPAHLESVHPGYLEYIFNISNNDKAPRNIRLTGANVWGGNISNISREVVVQGLSSHNVPLYVPTAIANIGSFNVYVNGRNSGNVMVDIRNDQNYRSSLPVLTSRKIKSVDESYNKFFPNFSDRSLNNESIGGKSISSFALTLINENINAWSKNWISYTGYAAIMLTSDEFNYAPSEVASAINRYVDTGGTLVIAGEYNPGKEFIKDNTGNNFESIDIYYKGFGALIVFKKEQSAEYWVKKEWGLIASQWQRTAFPFRFQSRTSRSSVASSMPVVEDNQIPVKSLFCVVLLFAILVGPVNLFFFAKKEKRMRIYWIVPLSSIAATLIIVLVSVLAEGIDSRVRTASVVYLNENEHRASILSKIGYYCPLPPSVLKFSNDIQLCCQTLTNEYDQGSGREIDYSDGQAYKNWISARMAEYFISRSSKNCRDHIAVRYDDSGNVSIVNNLNGDINKIMLSDIDGNIYSASDITAGQASDLKKTDMTPGTDELALRNIYGTNWSGLQYRNTETELHKWLKPGRYVAVMKNDGYSETGIEDFQSTGQECIIFGIINEKSLNKN